LGWSSGRRLRGNPTALVYYLAHALVIAIGVSLTLLHNTISTAVGTSLIATGAAGAFIYLYVARTDKARDAAEMLSDFGVAHIYERRAAQIRDEYATRLNKSRSQIDIIGFGLTDFRRDYMNQLASLAARATVRILLIDPDSPACSLRDKEEHQREGTINEEVKDFISDFKARYHSNASDTLTLKLYTCLPLINIFRIDDEVFWGPYLVGQASGNTLTIRVGRGKIFDQLTAHFEDIWLHYSHGIEDDDGSNSEGIVTHPLGPDGHG
jgi:hypothetical protein